MLIGIVYSLLAAGYFRAEAAQTKTQVLEKSLRETLRSIDSTRSTRYIAKFADLDGHGGVAAIVYMIGSAWCGSGGCTTLILTNSSTSWRLLTLITISRPPISLLKEKYHGWHSIALWVQGGGIQPGYEADLRFDGKHYPGNPSKAPRANLGAPTEAVIISSSKGSEPLY